MATHEAHRSAQHWRKVSERAKRPARKSPSPAGGTHPPPKAPAEPAHAESRREGLLRRLEERGVPAKFLREYDVDLERDPPLLPRLSAPSRPGPPVAMPRPLTDFVLTLKALWDRPRTIVLLGSRGLGKTALCCGLCKWFAERGRQNVAYCTAAEYVAGVMNQSQRTPREVVRRYQNAELLITDEIQQKGDALWKTDILSELFDYRWRNLKPTILVGNLEIEAMREHIGHQLYRRLLDGGLPVFVAKWRPIGPLLDDGLDWWAGENG